MSERNSDDDEDTVYFVPPLTVTVFVPAEGFTKPEMLMAEWLALREAYEQAAKQKRIGVITNLGTT